MQRDFDNNNMNIHEGHLGGYIKSSEQRAESGLNVVNGDPATWHPSLWLWAMSTLNIRSVLDVGCGEGHSSAFFKRYGCDVLGVDGSKQALQDSKIPEQHVQHDFVEGPYLPTQASRLAKLKFERPLMIGMEILQPTVALMIWTMIIWALMYATRIPAMNKSPDIESPAKLVGTTGAELRGKLPDSVNWKADNYNHLHEAPTVFYAVAIVLAILGEGDGPNAFLAWIYVGLRIAHSVVQVTANKVMVRFVLFALSSVVLITLIGKATIVVFGLGAE